MQNSSCSAEKFKVELERLILGNRNEKLAANLWVPEGSTSNVAILYLRGGPFRGGPPNFPHGTRLSLLELGYPLLEPRYSGSEDSVNGDRPISQSFSKAVSNTTVSTQYLTRKYKKVVIFGESLGALLAVSYSQTKHVSYPLVLYAPVMQTPRDFYINDRPNGVADMPGHLDANNPDHVYAMKVISDRLMQAYFGPTLDHALAEMLRNIRAPVLIVYGGADTLTPPQYVEAAKPQLPHVDFYLIPGAGHEGAEEQPWVPALAEKMASFIGR